MQSIFHFFNNKILTIFLVNFVSRLQILVVSTANNMYDFPFIVEGQIRNYELQKLHNAECSVPEENFIFKNTDGSFRYIIRIVPPAGQGFAKA
ncbi:hypothetical protein GDO78_013645 [Eleutherodactylus coqui]|uniref:Uncharacterized protein n=1 Tax=Eleutherodactylus coqui TaxID=57060 RepID=A0A8J6JXZ9_ELECQ|nr:hypothetical protein GDO78_013645 [Eleutherodactylus coqui]